MSKGRASYRDLHKDGYIFQICFCYKYTEQIQNYDLRNPLQTLSLQMNIYILYTQDTHYPIGFNPIRVSCQLVWTVYNSGVVVYVHLGVQYSEIWNAAC